MKREDEQGRTPLTPEQCQSEYVPHLNQIQLNQEYSRLQGLLRTGKATDDELRRLDDIKKQLAKTEAAKDAHLAEAVEASTRAREGLSVLRRRLSGYEWTENALGQPVLAQRATQAEPRVELTPAQHERVEEILSGDTIRASTPLSMRH